MKPTGEGGGPKPNEDESEDSTEQPAVTDTTPVTPVVPTPTPVTPTPVTVTPTIVTPTPTVQSVSTTLVSTPLWIAPVKQPLHPAGWKRPPGNTDFKVTQIFGCTGVTSEPPLGACPHYHRGIDIGNGQCGGDIVATRSGIVHYASTIAVPNAPGGVQTYICIDHGGGWLSGYIHEAKPLLVVKGQRVTQGQHLAHIGKVGATACHLHYLMKNGVDFSHNTLSDTNGHWLNPWSYILHV